MQYLKGDTVTQRFAMDTMAQDLQKREEPPRLEEGGISSTYIIHSLTTENVYIR